MKKRLKPFAKKVYILLNTWFGGHRIMALRNVGKTRIQDLDAFVRHSDDLGGPEATACQAYWNTLYYLPTTSVNQKLDPESTAYSAQMVQVYEEISNKTLHQKNHELTTFPLDVHIHAANPCNHPTPSAFAKQIQVLAKVCEISALPKGALVLDMGCGWGFSSELLAYCGFEVVSVDISPTFIQLVSTRAKNRSHQITPIESSFDDFWDERKFRLIVFYECFHHATHPWILLQKMARMLEPGGKIILAGEPIQNQWWEQWGLRLDPLSVYCMRKFGWFESGCSESFLRRMMEEAGLKFSRIYNPSEPMVPIYMGEQS